MKPYRPKATFTKIYIPTLEKLRKLSKKLKIDGIIILSGLVEEKYDKTFTK